MSLVVSNDILNDADLAKCFQDVDVKNCNAKFYIYLLPKEDKDNEIEKVKNNERKFVRFFRVNDKAKEILDQADIANGRPSFGMLETTPKGSKIFLPSVQAKEIKNNKNVFPALICSKKPAIFDRSVPIIELNDNLYKKMTKLMKEKEFI